MSEEKQAVLLIHGIGEQRPMDTLREFVHAVWPENVWSKPDTVSGSYELRRLTTAANAVGVRTDFYEFYWAHLMPDTTLDQVLAWARLLLLRWPWRIPAKLRLAWLLLLVLAGLVGVLVFNSMLPETSRILRMPAWTSAALALAATWFSSKVLKKIVGDAARYLDRAAHNIGRRQEIRSKGIEVLKKLHQGPYRRIIVVGHSLGSVIGYDVLTHAWPEFNRTHGRPDQPCHDALDRLESLSADPGQADAFRRAQPDYFAELRANGNGWRVSDFVTAGSPLAHAALLLATDEIELTNKQVDREFPTCPPELETERFSYDVGYSSDAGRLRTFKAPHHAAVFGPTRWTNLYFPAGWLIKGDLIGGPVAPSFGYGVRDVAVSTRKWYGLFSHTHYWTIDSSSVAVGRLRAALDL